MYILTLLVKRLRTQILVRYAKHLLIHRGGGRYREYLFQNISFERTLFLDSHAGDQDNIKT